MYLNNKLQMKKITKYISILLLAFLVANCKDNDNWTTILDQGVYLVSDSATIYKGESKVSKLTPIALENEIKDDVVGIYTWIKANNGFYISFADDAYSKRKFGKGTDLSKDNKQAYSLSESGAAFVVNNDGFYQVVVNSSTMEVNIIPVKWKVNANTTIDFKSPKFDEKEKYVEWTTDGLIDLGKYNIGYDSQNLISSGNATYQINSVFTGIVDTLSENFIKIVPLNKTGTQLENKFKANYTFTVRYNIDSKEFSAKALKGYPKLFVPGGHSGWGHTYYIISPTYNSSFEGFMHIENDFKFTSAPNWDGVNYGYGGDGILSKDGSAGNLNLPEGFYILKANTESLTWSAQKVEWGLVGDATPNGWGGPDVVMKDLKNNTLTVTTDLVAGFIKFRMNNKWGGDYGGAGGKLNQADNNNIPIADEGNYTITISFATPPEYTYTIKKN